MAAVFCLLFFTRRETLRNRSSSTSSGFFISSRHRISNSSPTRSGNALGDILGGMNLAIGVLVALQARNITGEGQYVDVALVDSVAASLEQAWQRYFVSGELPTRHAPSGSRWARRGSCGPAPAQWPHPRCNP